MNEALGTTRGGTSVDEPVFIVGTTRSGTTLLSLMLGHHPEVAFVGELEWVWDFAPGKTPSLEPYYAWLATHRHYRTHRLRVDRSLGFADLVRSFFRQMRADADPGATRARAGCQVHRHYAQALELWPRALFIHIVRDGRDVCASWIKFGWLGNAYEAGQRWRWAIIEWATVKPHIDPARRVEIRFEELIRAPERELARLCEFIGVPYSEAMLRYHEDTTYEPIDPRQAGKWREQLDGRDIRLFEAMAGKELVECDYELSGEKPYSLRPWSDVLLRFEGKLRHHRARMRIFGPGLWLADLLTRWLRLKRLQDRVRLALNDVESARVK